MSHVQVSPDSVPQQGRDKTPLRTYRRRWYVLAVFSAVTFAQGLVWNTWGPLADSGRLIFGWTGADVALLANWGCIIYLVTCAFFSYLMDTKGLRVAAVSTVNLVFVGSAIRCLTVVIGMKTWIVHLGQAVNALAGPVCFGAPPLLSDVWFPIHERSTATAISVMSSYFGVASSYILGITFVHGPEHNNGTNSSYAVGEVTGDVSIQRSDIERLLFTECALGGVLSILVLTYFPAKPPSPPSVSAFLPRANYRYLIPRLLRNCQLWCIVAAGGLASGIYGTWLSLLDTNLGPFGFTQREAGLLGVYSSLAACVSAVIISRFSDKFSRGLKFMLIGLSAVGTLSYLMFSLLCQRTIAYSAVFVYITCILGGMVVNAAIPLYYEFVCDCGYPLPEGASATFLTIFNNVVGFSFYMILQIPAVGTEWINWTLVGAVAAGMVLLWQTKNTYSRSKIDHGT
ncbi:solute carrier family 49 member 4-like isoform X1 [Liolophura sinensis]|uniref:solute carrier family 49 member 4-like isoform X1 n=1 Tax=Liolophura sinensis TaxID=3198878 RepID=UPI0031581F31